MLVKLLNTIERRKEEHDMKIKNQTIFVRKYQSKITKEISEKKKVNYLRLVAKVGIISIRIY